MPDDHPQRGGRPSWAVLCAALALPGLAAGCGDPEPVVVGVSLPGVFVDATRLAVDDALAGAPIPAFDTVVIPESTNRAEPAIGAAERLVSTPGIVGVVGHSNSAASLAASQIYNRRRVVQVAPTSTAVLYSEAGPFSFRLVPPNDRQGAFLARRLSESYPEGRRVALFYVNDAYGRDLRSAFLDEVDADRFPVVADLPHSEGNVTPESVDYAVEAASAADPELVLWLARGTVLAPFIRGLRGALGDVPVLGGDAAVPPQVPSGEEHLWRGVRYAEFVDLDGTPERRDFVRRYAERFDREPRGSELLSYDAMSVVIAGIRAGARSGEELREYLASLGRERPAFEGVTGAITFHEHGDVERSFVIESVLPEEE